VSLQEWPNSVYMENAFYAGTICNLHEFGLLCQRLLQEGALRHSSAPSKKQQLERRNCTAPERRADDGGEGNHSECEKRKIGDWKLRKDRVDNNVDEVLYFAVNVWTLGVMPYFISGILIGAGFEEGLHRRGVSNVGRLQWERCCRAIRQGGNTGDWKNKHESRKPYKKERKQRSHNHGRLWQRNPSRGHEKNDLAVLFIMLMKTICT